MIPSDLKNEVLTQGGRFLSLLQRGLAPRSKGKARAAPPPKIKGKEEGGKEGKKEGRKEGKRKGWQSVRRLFEKSGTCVCPLLSGVQRVESFTVLGLRWAMLPGSPRPDAASDCVSCSVFLQVKWCQAGLTDGV